MERLRKIECFVEDDATYERVQSIIEQMSGVKVHNPKYFNIDLTATWKKIDEAVKRYNSSVKRSYSIKVGCARTLDKIYNRGIHLFLTDENIRNNINYIVPDEDKVLNGKMVACPAFLSSGALIAAAANINDCRTVDDHLVRLQRAELLWYKRIEKGFSRKRTKQDLSLKIILNGNLIVKRF